MNELMVNPVLMPITTKCRLAVKFMSMADNPSKFKYFDKYMEQNQRRLKLTIPKEDVEPLLELKEMMSKYSLHEQHEIIQKKEQEEKKQLRAKIKA